MTEERFILEVTTDYKPVLRNIKKYESFMNYLFAKDKNPMMALETLANGVLYFFESMKSFRGFIDKVVKGLKSLENPSCFHKKSIFLNFFLHRVIKKKKFPEKGVEFNAEMIGNPDQVKDFIEKYNEKY